MVGLIIAMPQELEPYKQHITKTQNIYGKDFYIGKIGDKDIVICLSGIGKVNAAFATTLMIDNFKPNLIINTGVSGGLGRLKPYDIVVAQKVVQHDVDTTALGDPKGKVSTVNKIFFKTSEKINEKIIKYINNAQKGILACGDQFIADKNKIKQIVDDFDAIACDMESGAVAQIADISGIDVVIIRGISDGADEDAPTDFLALLDQISKKVYLAVKTVIEKL